MNIFCFSYVALVDLNFLMIFDARKCLLISNVKCLLNIHLWYKINSPCLKVVLNFGFKCFVFNLL